MNSFFITNKVAFRDPPITSRAFMPFYSQTSRCHVITQSMMWPLECQFFLSLAVFYSRAQISGYFCQFGNILYIKYKRIPVILGKKMEGELSNSESYKQMFQIQLINSYSACLQGGTRIWMQHWTKTNFERDQVTKSNLASALLRSTFFSFSKCKFTPRLIILIQALFILFIYLSEAM